MTYPVHSSRFPWSLNDKSPGCGQFDYSDYFLGIDPACQRHCINCPSLLATEGFHWCPKNACWTMRCKSTLIRSILYNKNKKLRYHITTRQHRTASTPYSEFQERAIAMILVVCRRPYCAMLCYFVRGPKVSGDFSNNPPPTHPHQTQHLPHQMCNVLCEGISGGNRWSNMIQFLKPCIQLDSICIPMSTHWAALSSHAPFPGFFTVILPVF